MNYPLRDGIDDESYEAIFKPVRLSFEFDLVATIPIFPPRRLMCMSACVRSWLKSWRCTSPARWSSSVEPILSLETDWAASTSPSKV